jgi:hypothetical protein
MYLKFNQQNNRLCPPAYSNLAYISTHDLAVDKPHIYSIERPENDIHVINKFIKIYYFVFFLI